MENNTEQDQQKKAENIRKKWTLTTIGLSALSMIMMVLGKKIQDEKEK